MAASTILWTPDAPSASLDRYHLPLTNRDDLTRTSKRAELAIMGNVSINEYGLLTRLCHKIADIAEHNPTVPGKIGCRRVIRGWKKTIKKACEEAPRPKTLSQEAPSAILVIWLDWALITLQDTIKDLGVNIARPIS